jgi:hypothetical protein
MISKLTILSIIIIASLSKHIHDQNSNVALNDLIALNKTTAANT